MHKVGGSQKLNTLRVFGALLVILVVFSLPGYGQGGASIVGTVTDATGSVVPSAKIAITNIDTGIVRSTESNATGNYAARELAIGRYTVRVGAAGFKAYE